MAGKVVGIGFEIISRLDSYLNDSNKLQVVYPHQNSVSDDLKLGQPYRIFWDWRVFIVYKAVLLIVQLWQKKGKSTIKDLQLKWGLFERAKPIFKMLPFSWAKTMLSTESTSFQRGTLGIYKQPILL